MARTKGSINKELPRVPDTVPLTTEQKIEFLANLIVERIMADQGEGQVLLKEIEGTYAARITSA